MSWGRKKKQDWRGGRAKVGEREERREGGGGVIKRKRTTQKDRGWHIGGKNEKRLGTYHKYKDVH